MNKEELAALLNGREYRKEMTAAENASAEAAGLVVVHGYSDDGMTFAGAINDEVDCFNGGVAYLDQNGLLTNDCDSDDCPHFLRAKAKAVTIEAVWCAEGYSWVYRTKIPYATFDIVEDGEKYCRGIVFSMTDLAGEAEHA